MKNVFDHKISQKIVNLGFNFMITVLKRFTTTSRSRPQSLHMQPKIMGLRATPTAACIVCDHPLFNQPLPRRTQTHTHTRANAVAHHCPHIVRTVVRLTLASLTTATTMWSELKDGQNVS